MARGCACSSYPSCSYPSCSTCLPDAAQVSLRKCPHSDCSSLDSTIPAKTRILESSPAESIPLDFTHTDSTISDSRLTDPTLESHKLESSVTIKPTESAALESTHTESMPLESSANNAEEQVRLESMFATMQDSSSNQTTPNDKFCHLPFEDASFDIVTMLAVLEHLNHPQAMLQEIARILKPQGICLLTVPSHFAKPVLEFLAYRLKIVSEAEIRDHKRYYNRSDLYALASSTPLQLIKHSYFQLGMNNFAIMQLASNTRF